MTQNNLRKEPTFGQPSHPANLDHNPVAEAAEKASINQPVAFSMHSKQSPGHTFTPLVKRSEAEQAAISAAATAAKEALAKNTTEKSIPTATSNNAKVAPTLGFAFTPVEKDANATAANSKPLNTESLTTHQPQTESKKMEQTSQQNHEHEKEANNLERVIPSQAQTAPKKPSLAEKVPSKYRRLLLVALLALALILVFFLLKPKTPQSVEDLQAQGSSLPIEFRPVDEEEAKRAEEEARALQQRLEAEKQAQANSEAASSITEQTEAATIETPVQSEVSQELALTTATETAALKPAVTTAPAEVTVSKPNAHSSVIHQPEVVKAEPAKPAKSLKQVTANTKADSIKTQSHTVKTKSDTATNKPATVATPATSNAVSSKTITVQKGVSLFQNFRDNGLGANLPELNKMTKLNGATSRLSPGQKITVRLDKNNRIVEMNIGSGKYIRQADGNYIYR
ncbi:Opacity associated protein A [Bibersteinia trehalosi USDA-ARS-USMARC-190]|uniref:Opacity associated protein A n=1 Tax=Bibersteinia trehalosi USDA-ARS-USMARC-190 TaxID=1263832 RepID=W0RAE4_BIBTR|nr:LysM-like peptidoglycan-binding domain-containing protein [Bibersteinia trehalosi]AHG87275.1 Opacity associated protein A [Bibersteinia trehalosi USDA-ARS-USMARC-190]